MAHHHELSGKGRMLRSLLKTFLGIIIIIFVSFRAHSQNVNQATVSGSLLNSDTQQPVQYAKATLLTAKGEIVVDSDLSRMNGFFKIRDLVAGTYVLRVDAPGYDAKMSPIEITNNDE